MELQLGLALSTSPVKRFDLNKYVYEPRETVGSDTWSHDGCLGKNKRGFRDAFEMISPVARTLPLLLWNDKPNDGDDRKSLERSSSCTINESDGDGDSIVGWPPIEAWRKKKLHNQFQRRGPNSMYVKVRMEGEAIGRKVDLSLHSSYQTLITTLIGMFGKYQRSVKGSKEGAGYTLTYQDKEGDWLLVGDVPWETFIGSVQRLKIQRSEG